jgi:hypothetical protein
VMTPIESAVEGSLEGSRGDRSRIPATCRAGATNSIPRYTTIGDSTQINALKPFDVIIHNAGEYGLSDPEILNANSLSPYLLTNRGEVSKR